jgi:hypothetical protein
MRSHRIIAALALATAALVSTACGTTEVPDHDATAKVATTSVAQAPSSSVSPTLGITEMYGAFWAAYVPDVSATLGTTEMYGAFWAG